MAFFGGLKRALGWSDGEDDDDYIVMDSSADKDSVPVAKKEDNSIPKNPDEIPDGIFDGLIEIINANLSPMVLKCLDVDAEKRYLYEALGPKFAGFVKDVKEKGITSARADWDKEKNALNAKVEEYKSRCEAAEAERNEIKAQKISEDRQKAALKERLRTLEDQVASAEAEKEQYDLENKSLLNKLKVVQVKTDAVEAAEAEVRELTAQLVEMKRKMADGSATDERVKQLEEEYNAKMEVNNALINELRSEAVRNKEALDAKEAELAKLKEETADNDKVVENARKELEDAKTATAQVQAELEAAKAEISEKTAEMEEMTENLAMLDTIQEQLDKVEDFKKKKEEEVAMIQAKCMELQSQHSAISAQNDAAQSQIDEMQSKINLLEQEKAKALEAARDGELLNGRIAELELALAASNEKITALSQESTDTLELLHRRDELVAEQKNEIEEYKRACEVAETALNEVKADFETLRSAHESEINAMKTADVEKTKKFQAEIAELQAKLNVEGHMDDLLVDDDLRQAVEETFDISLGDDDLGGFDMPEDNAEKKEIVFDELPAEQSKANDAEKSSETTVADSDLELDAELDDIDWLLPDTGNVIAPEPEEPAKADEPDTATANDTQMSLFG